MPADRIPIGLQLTRAARLVSRAFDDALAAAGGSQPTWLVLLNLKIGSVANQRELAEAIGVSPPTLTHHLNAMEAGGLLARRRDPANRRNHIIELTEGGEQAFTRLRDAAIAFDSRLRAGLAADDLVTLGAQLEHLSRNAQRPSDPIMTRATEPSDGGPPTPWKRSGREGP